jgi:hypothetical protein
LYLTDVTRPPQHQAFSSMKLNAECYQQLIRHFVFLLEVEE